MLSLKYKSYGNSNLNIKTMLFDFYFTNSKILPTKKYSKVQPMLQK